MSGLIKREIKVAHGLALTLIFILISGCATSPAPYVVEPKVLPTVQFLSQHPPTVRVRPASSEEAENITQFPGKERPGSLVWTDTVGTLLLAPAILVFLGPGLLMPESSKGRLKNNPAIKKVLKEFPSRLREAIEQRLSVFSSGESSDILEVLYFAGVNCIWSKGDQECFVVHAQITLKSQGQKVFQDIIHIDPRAYNSDVQKPRSYWDNPKENDIINFADEIIPEMIETRLPGLPWKSKELKENNKLLEGR
jgi:hypothetical protein